MAGKTLVKPEQIERALSATFLFFFVSGFILHFLVLALRSSPLSLALPILPQFVCCRLISSSSSSREDILTLYHSIQAKQLGEWPTQTQTQTRTRASIQKSQPNIMPTISDPTWQSILLSWIELCLRCLLADTLTKPGQSSVNILVF